MAEALIKRHLYLAEKALGWKINLKYKLSNYRTHLRKLRCPEVIVNALKHKPDGTQSPAYNVKKPKKGEVDPYNPIGENGQTLGIARGELLSDVKKSNNRDIIKTKMQRTVALRRHEVLCCAPTISDFVMIWPALFDVSVVCDWCLLLGEYVL